MEASRLTSLFGRHDFAIRRLHSLLGLMPIGGYLVFHLATNAAIIDGPAAYQHRADQLHKLGPTTIVVLEWSLIFLPILFHGIVGLMIVSRGKRNVLSYPYADNWRYTLQRLSGALAFAFILWHVFDLHGWLRWSWWVENVARPLGGARFIAEEAPATAAAAIGRAWWVIAFYAVGVTASVYHLANGLWTMGMSWGVWTSEAARRRMNLPCAVVGVVLLTIGLAALGAMVRAGRTPAAGREPAGTAVLKRAAPVEAAEESPLRVLGLARDSGR